MGADTSAWAAAVSSVELMVWAVLQIRDVLDLFWDATIGSAKEAAEKYATDIEGLPEVQPVCSRASGLSRVHALSANQ